MRRATCDEPRATSHSNLMPEDVNELEPTTSGETPTFKAHSLIMLSRLLSIAAARPPWTGERHLTGILSAVLVTALAACSQGADTLYHTGSDSSIETVRVSAAASLTDAFTDLESQFETAHPALDVELNFAGSSALREQILEGAPVDVFASANASNMRALVDANVVTRRSDGGPVIFARNRLQIAVPRGNPGGVNGLSDFAREELLIGLCADPVPCGELGRLALAGSGIDAAVDTNEPDVRALLTKIEAGELDAGIVYATDVAAAGDSVEGIVIPSGANVAADYYIAPLLRAHNPAGARAFVDYSRSPEGQAVLVRHGFSLP